MSESSECRTKSQDFHKCKHLVPLELNANSQTKVPVESEQEVCIPSAVNDNESHLRPRRIAAIRRTAPETELIDFVERC